CGSGCGVVMIAVIVVTTMYNATIVA
ncbi:hypothetical protein A2U01_0079223, partial [Trifolium medium]|nr:hypothetical protein [Trifolium medium]